MEDRVRRSIRCLPRVPQRKKKRKENEKIKMLKDTTQI